MVNVRYVSHFLSQQPFNALYSIHPFTHTLIRPAHQERQPFIRAHSHCDSASCPTRQHFDCSSKELDDRLPAGRQKTSFFFTGHHFYQHIYLTHVEPIQYIGWLILSVDITGVGRHRYYLSDTKDACGNVLLLNSQ